MFIFIAVWLLLMDTGKQEDCFAVETLGELKISIKNVLDQLLCSKYCVEIRSATKTT